MEKDENNNLIGRSRFAAIFGRQCSSSASSNDKIDSIGKKKSSNVTTKIFAYACAFLILSATTPVEACSGGSSRQSDGSSGSSGNRCADLVLFPVGSVDPADQYRFDYSDVGFGTTHSQGASVTVTCTSNGQSASVYAFDNSRTAISSGSSIVSTCSGGNIGWTVGGRRLQYVDCRVF